MQLQFGIIVTYLRRVMLLLYSAVLANNAVLAQTTLTPTRGAAVLGRSRPSSFTTLHAPFSWPFFDVRQIILRKSESFDTSLNTMFRNRIQTQNYRGTTVLSWFVFY